MTLEHWLRESRERFRAEPTHTAASKSLRDFCRGIYRRTLRPHLPTVPLSCNGVEVPGERALLDVITTAKPDFEAALLDGIEATVEAGDRVVIVGGGLGVSTVAALQASAPDGEVVVYEAGAEQAKTVRRTLAHNVPDETGRCTVRALAVGSVSDFAADSYAIDDPDVVSPATLPACDVLVLDCEGAEKEVLAGLDDRPRELVVEHHGFLGVSRADVQCEFDRLGFEAEYVGTEAAMTDVHVVRGIQGVSES